MVELEADDALASAARIAADDDRVEKVCIWTVDKDLAQCVRGDRVVQAHRIAKVILDAEGVRRKFGVEPTLIPDFLALGGDSAGAALCVATLCALRDAGAALPAAALLLCPWTEPLAAGGSMERNADADFADRELLVSWVEATGGDPLDPRLTVRDAKLAGLPPLLVQVGGAELLYDQVQRFAAAARAAGVAVELEEYADMFHDFQLQAALLPEGAAALEAAARFLRARVPAA